VSVADEQQQVEALEMELLLVALASTYGYDFREYARPSLVRRLRYALEKEELRTFSALQERVLRDRECLRRLVESLCIRTTTMFRDTDVYQAIRRDVVPLLRTYPFVRIWHAGCSTGEEVYSLCMLLEEEGLYDRCRVYATDLSVNNLERARLGIYPLHAMQEYTTAYQRAGGKEAFSRYYIADRSNAILQQSLRRNVIFAQHNLACDGMFNDFHMVLCRNVMIYFADPLRARVHALLYDSLVKFGLLSLGKKESLDSSGLQDRYEELRQGTRLYRRMR
jgi:chemotaxis protein methyltransferase CheR